ncbi:hypothetical protein [Kineococcus rubinsiae]|uniref:hypothetical protein n=1 Tax=Kineococcus rubinsiae TaxID=2609562 RepID=UPI0014321A95|nr:hypothetical protein [Kineococcus rubinsiae]NIZ90854.1 hypothetical protein [Kineococcus rubinsiae]
MPPAAPVQLRTALLAAVACARAGDGPGVAEQTGHLARLDVEQVRSVVGWLLRSLLEERHPDGLDSDDLRDTVSAAARAALPWFDELDPQVLVGVLTGALGVHDAAEGGDPVDPLLAVQHAVVLVAELAAGPGPGIAAHLDAALAELRRAETVEMP